MTNKTPNIDTQSQRRVKYGLNVAVAVVAAVAIAVLVNWISYKNFRGGGTRLDLTSTRQYSLSPLTRKVLDRFDGDYRIVTLLDPIEETREDTQRARDLVEEYARASEKVTVEHINPATDLVRHAAFEKAVYDRFAEQFEPLKKAIAEGITALETARTQLNNQRSILGEILKDTNSLKETDPRRANLFQTQRFFEAQADALNKALETLKTYDSVSMPSHTSAYQAVKETIESLDMGFYPSVLKTRITPLIDDVKTPDLVKDGLLQLNELIKEAMASRKDLLVELSKAMSVPQYDALLSRLSQPNPVVILGPSDVVAINLAELFRSSTQAPDPNNKAPSEELEEKQFLGEERLTGVLARMTVTQLKPPPMVVFVATGNGPASQPKQNYVQLLDRLRSMNLQVETWEPVRQSPFMDPRSKPLPPPSPQPGQRVVWVLLPGDPPDPQNPGGQKTVEAAVKLVAGRVAKGDGLLAIVGPEVEPAALSNEVLQEWGIKVSTQHAILREVINRYGQNTPYNEHDIRTWPQEMPVSKAIGEAGMTAHFVWTSPVEVAEQKPNVSYYPLARITGNNLWGNVNTAEEVKLGRTVQLDAGDAKRDEFTVALAAEQPMKDRDFPRRLVIVGDAYFATDRFGAAEFVDPVSKRVSQMTPYPGNHELFVNSVYWLAGLEELIAASARSQDVRRVGAMSASQLAALQWTMLIGLPLGTLVIGLGVWMTRRG